MDSTNDLPKYFDEASKIFSEEILNSLISIEEAFDKIYYNQHIDDIDSLFSTGTHKGTSEFCSTVLEVYREHINAVLSAQGIFVANPFTESLSNLIELLEAVVLLGTVNKHDLYHIDEIKDEDTDDTYFAKAVSLFTNLSVEAVLDIVVYVNASVVAYLDQDNPMPIFLDGISKNAESRFKSSPIPKKGIIVDTIRAMSKFGYSLKTFIVTHAHLISELDSNELIANEIILLVLGSNSDNRMLLVEALDASEHICNDARQILSVNSLIEKYFKENTYE